MDKNAIKKYAVWARRELISRVSHKAAFYGITDTDHGTVGAESVDERVLTAAEKKQRDALIHQIQKDGYEQTIEEVAYTWFNRFSALRYMEVNGYLPTHVRVFTDDAGALKPQILTEAINLELDGLDMQKVYDLKNSNQDEALYRYLLITQCNALNAILPGMFQKIEDYTELLLPDNLLREGSVIEQMVTTIPEEDWTDQVQIIGWLYQYYNAEKKDDVFAALKKNVKITKENIPAATQLFTPDWIVRYMVENSLGRLWLEGHPDVKNQLLPTEEEQSAYAAGNRDPEGTKWHYYLEEAKQEPAVEKQLAEIRKEYAALTPEQLKVIDPCMGSGHILVYMFDVLVKIYESYGYTTRDAVSSIVENNLYGLDIDDRAAQLAYFAVMMKARQYDRRFFSRVVQPHVYAIVESNGLDSSSVEYFTNNDPQLKKDFGTLMDELRDAKEYGSILNISQVDFSALYARVEEVRADISMFREIVLNSILPLIQVAEVMVQKYDTVVTNPPYMGASGMSGRLSDYVKKNYPDSKSDLSTVFMEKTIRMCFARGYMAMINIPVWMFLTSYENLRCNLIKQNTIYSVIHPGRGVFGSDFGSVAFVIRNKHIGGFEGSYRRLFENAGDVESVDTREQQFLSGKGQFTADQDDFGSIPGYPIAYWVSKQFIKAFEHPRLGTVLFPKTGLTTGDNDTYLRLWFEVSKAKIGKKWFYMNKGGEFHKWYGNNEYVLNWENNGFAVRNAPGSTIRNPEYYFREGVTWSKITAYKFSGRYSPSTHLFDAVGLTCFANNNVDLMFVLAYFCSCVANHFLSVLNSTVTFTTGSVSNIPFAYPQFIVPRVKDVAKSNVDHARNDWDSYETSWDFKRNPLVNGKHLTAIYTAWKQECEDRFQQLKKNEEELNRIFIDIYGLQDELTPDVADKDVTVHRVFDSKDDVPESMKGSNYVRTMRDEIVSLISYAVGCMFGRYSLDVDGLAYAGGEWDASKYKTIIPDSDNIIPICDDDYFDDDITGRFVKWVEAVYGEDTLDENLKFIADALGGKGAPKEVIRNYFLNDFYADHCKIYQKRPIYWLFDSGKKNGFKALIYMHRYREDTIARIRTDYVHEQQGRYRTAIADLESRIANADTGSRVKLTKQLTKLQNQAEELRVYEEKIHHLADQMIRIDLDDGVKHNYEIFKDVLAKIK